MNKLRLIILYIILLLSQSLRAANNDSLFISNIKMFIYEEFGTNLKYEIYTRFDKDDKPTVLIYVSLAEKIKSPESVYNNNVPLKNEIIAQEKEEFYKSLGYHVFIYKTYGFYIGQLTTRFLSY